MLELAIAFFMIAYILGSVVTFHIFEDIKEREDFTSIAVTMLASLVWPAVVLWIVIWDSSTFIAKKLHLY